MTVTILRSFVQKQHYGETFNSLCNAALSMLGAFVTLFIRFERSVGGPRVLTRWHHVSPHEDVKTRPYRCGAMCSSSATITSHSLVPRLAAMNTGN